MLTLNMSICTYQRQILHPASDSRAGVCGLYIWLTSARLGPSTSWCATLRLAGTVVARNFDEGAYF